MLLTSYGILRRDIKELSQYHFTLAVFDEAQYIKNAETQVYEAACKIQVDMKLGVTGTPIENRLSDIKALMDVVLPGYLVTDSQFQYSGSAFCSGSSKAHPLHLHPDQSAGFVCC